MTPLLVFVVILWAGLSAFAGEYVAKQKGRPPFEGLVFGLLFGPFGPIIEGTLPNGPGVEQRP